MNWARMLAYITGTVDQELLVRNEYLAAENRTYYVLFFIQLESRRVCLAGITPHPEQQWMEQMGRNVTMQKWGFLAILSETRRNISHKRSIEAIARTARSGAVRSWDNLRFADEPGSIRAYLGLFNPGEKKRRSRSPAHPLAATEPYGSLLLLLFFWCPLLWVGRCK